MTDINKIDDLHIIILIESSKLGGAERQAILLTRELRNTYSACAQVWILKDGPEIPQSNASVPYLCKQYGIPWRVIESTQYINWDSMSEFTMKFAQELKHNKIDVLLPYWLPCNIACAISSQLAGLNACIWGQRDEGRTAGINSHLIKIAAYSSNRFISNSSTGADFLTNILKVTENRVCIIPNAVDLPQPIKSPEEWREELGIIEKTLIVCMIAHITMDKDHTTLLHAWRLLLDTTFSEYERKPHLYLLGAPVTTTLNKLKKLINKLDISKHVTFIDNVQDISGFLTIVDICVHSSQLEGIPNSVLEAMSAGVPTVGTDIPGIRYAMGEGNKQYLVPEKDPSSIATAISSLAEDDQLRLQIGGYNRQRSRELFTPERLASNTVKIIIETLNNPTPWSLTGILLRNKIILRTSLYLITTRHEKIFYIKKLALKALTKTPLLWRLTK